MNDFAVTDNTRLRRLHERGHFDRETVYAILDAGMICHVGYVIDGAPYVTPTIFWREDNRVYWHGSSASRMLRHQGHGAPVCLTVSHFDGLVLARSGFHHSVNYRSAMLFGDAEAVSDPDEKTMRLKNFVDGLYPGRWDEMRPMTGQELKATTMLSLEIDEVSAKIRTGDPVDDEEDYALDIWAGVLPLEITTGRPIPDARLKDGIPEPEYLKSFRAG